MRVFNKRIVILVSLILVASASANAPANAASTSPKVGNCYNLSNAQIDAEYSPKNAPINCARLHNAETYRIAKWPLKTNPVDMDPQDALDIADSLCQPWEPEESQYFNFYAWYTPDKSSWAKGARWVRCDALITKNDQAPFIFKKWLFKRLDIR